MTVKAILEPIINQELAKYQVSGQQIHFKSATGKRIKYTVFCLLGALAVPPISTIIALIVYINLMKKVNPVDLIIDAAKKKPDTPITQIMAEEIVLK